MVLSRIVVDFRAMGIADAREPPGRRHRILAGVSLRWDFSMRQRVLRRSLREQERDGEPQRPVGAEVRLLDVVVGLERHVDWLRADLEHAAAAAAERDQPGIVGTGLQLAVMIGAEVRNQPPAML
jgi:hypothetical protein